MDLLELFKKLRIGVLGDIMVDTYLWGKVERISPEAPVPIVSLQKKENRIGGAGNVVLNLSALGVKADLISVVGKDAMGAELRLLMKQFCLEPDFIVQSDKRITTSKTRVICQNQQMIRIDNEMTNDLSANEEEEILGKFKEYIVQKKPHLLIMEDYNKGVLTEKVITSVIRICKEHNVLIAVDPKEKNFFSYKGVDIIKPNLKEVIQAVGVEWNDISSIALGKLHDAMKERLNHKISLISLSEHGVYYNSDNNALIIPSHRRVIADVSGAGDTVIAVATAVFAATGDIHFAAEIANLAGGLVCEEVGTSVVNPLKLMQEAGKAGLI